MNLKKQINTMTPFRVLVLLVIFSGLIIPAAAIFSLEETTGRTEKNLTIGEVVEITANITLLPRGQPFQVDNSIVITSDLTGKEFFVEIYADDHYQHSFRHENTFFITGQFLSYRTSPVESHRYKGSTVTIRVKGNGMVPETTSDTITLLEVIELDRTGKPVLYAIESIKAPVQREIKIQEEIAAPVTPKAAKEQAPVQVITLIAASLAGMYVVAIRK